MKRGFTLLELLITVTVMATLMTVMFRLGTSSSDESKRITTVTRLQKLENCLSGYYSAFGSYPPVAIHGSRDIYTEVRNGVQTDSRNGSLSWDQIEAACRSQPLEACFPFSDADEEMIRSYSDLFRELSSSWGSDCRNAAAYSSGFSRPSPGEFTSYWRYSDWRKVQLFKFGVMSFLLPRYLVMMSGDSQFYGAGGNDACAQWENNNDSCISATDGREMSWKDVYQATERNDDNTVRDDGIVSLRDYIKVANMPTQSVCARWIGNLEGICATGSSSKRAKIFGVNVKDSWNMFECDEDEPPKHLNIYSPGGNGGSWYVLNTITVLDGWKNTYYYYSPSGAQSYALWSAGANGRTFPPWVDKTGMMDQKPSDPYLNSKYTIGEWLEDDIGGMKH